LGSFPVLQPVLLLLFLVVYVLAFYTMAIIPAEMFDE